MDRNYTISIIEIPFAKISSLPSELEIDGVKVKFELISPTTISAKFNFDTNNFTQQEAEAFTKTFIRNIALKLSLDNSLSVIWNSNTSTTWEKLSNDGVTKTTTITARARISAPLQVKLTLDDLKLAYSNGKSDLIIDALDFYNRALSNKEHNRNEREVALWLNMSWEAIQLALNKNENDLISMLVAEGRFKGKELKEFKYSVGLHYRHVKGKGYNDGYRILKINECITYLKKILVALTS